MAAPFVRYASAASWAVVLACATAACDRPAEEMPAGGESAMAAADSAAPGGPWHPFDPDTVEVGASAGGLVLDTLIRRGEHSGADADVAVFDGEIELSGRTLLHPDADLGLQQVCFEADYTTSHRLPRMTGDERRPWFCFNNTALATERLAGPGIIVAATVVIDSFTNVRGSSDEVNSATLLRVSEVSDVSGEASRVAAAEAIVAFLRGERALDIALVSDTVTLYVAPEGGGGSRQVRRSELADRRAWSVGSTSLLPFDGAATLTTAPGRHLNCRQFALASRFASLAELPHVGASLQADGATSCLQTWNMTFVFDDESDDPEIVAVVYDQWEW